MLAATGIYLNDLESPLSTSNVALKLRTVDDLRVIKSPPFWTPERFGVTLGLLLSMGAALAIWSFTLKRQVRKQSRILAAKTEQEKVQEERNRISRELHDTLEQDWWPYRCTSK